MRKKQALIKALNSVPPPPCETCAHFQKCKIQKTACTDFRIYVDYGSTHAIQIAACAARNRMGRAKKLRAGAKKDSDEYCKADKQFCAAKSEYQKLTAYGAYDREPTRKIFLGLSMER